MVPGKSPLTGPQSSLPAAHSPPRSHAPPPALPPCWLSEGFGHLHGPLGDVYAQVSDIKFYILSSTVSVVLPVLDVTLGVLF